MKNTKTTLAGIGAILVAVGGALKALFDGDPTTHLDITTTIATNQPKIAAICVRTATTREAPEGPGFDIVAADRAGSQCGVYSSPTQVG